MGGWGTYTVAVVRQPTPAQRERWRDQGDLIRRLREHVPMSQKDLAGRLDMSAKTLIQIEKGRRPLDQWEMDRLVDVLGMPPVAFIDPPPRSQTIEVDLESYLARYAGEVAAEAASQERRQREPRRRRERPASRPPRDDGTGQGSR